LWFNSDTFYGADDGFRGALLAGESATVEFRIDTHKLEEIIERCTRKGPGMDIRLLFAYVLPTGASLSDTLESTMHIADRDYFLTRPPSYIGKSLGPNREFLTPKASWFNAPPAPSVPSPAPGPTS